MAAGAPEVARHSNHGPPSARSCSGSRLRGRSPASITQSGTTSSQGILRCRPQRARHGTARHGQEIQRIITSNRIAFRFRSRFKLEGRSPLRLFLFNSMPTTTPLHTKKRKGEKKKGALKSGVGQGHSSHSLVAATHVVHVDPFPVADAVEERPVLLAHPCVAVGGLEELLQNCMFPFAPGGCGQRQVRRAGQCGRAPARGCSLGYLRESFSRPPPDRRLPFVVTLGRERQGEGCSHRALPAGAGPRHAAPAGLRADPCTC